MSRRPRLLAALAAVGALAALPVAAGAQDGASDEAPATTTTTTAAPSAGGVAIAGRISMSGTSSTSPNTLIDSGTVTGTPFGSGTTLQTYQLFPRRGVAKVTISITTDAGTASGIAYARYTTTDVALVFTGAGRFTSGTGAYAGMSTGILQFNATHSKTGKREAFSMIGSLTDRGGAGQQQLGAFRTELGVPDPGVLRVGGGTTMIGRPGRNQFKDAGVLRGNPGGSVTSVDTFTSKIASRTEFTIANGDGEISGTVIASRATTGAKLRFEGYGMVTSATGAYAGMLNDLVRYRAVYIGGVGTVSYVGSTSQPSRASTVAAIRRFAATIGAPVPPSLRG